MLIPAWLYSGAFYGLLGCAGIAVLYYSYRERPAADQLPRAELATNRWRARVWPWVPRFALVGGLLGAWMLNRVSVDVIRVRDTGGRPAVQHLKHLGDPDFTLAPGEKKREDDIVGYDTWVLNESQHPVRIETTTYGRAMWGASDPRLIPQGTAAATSGIEYIGPSDPPPSTLQVDGVEAKIGVTSRSWLTWD